MNKNKISPKLLNSVTILSKQKESVFISSNDFDRTKYFLDKYKYNYVPYRFANCICTNFDFEDISIFSNLNSTKFIFSNSEVQSERLETDFLKIENLTENKFFGQNQTICFIDTGIYPHFDFLFPKSRILKFIDLVNQESTPYDDNGHGTFVAGIACGNGIYSPDLKGFAPMSNIISIKALNKKGNSSSNTILDAMEWVFQNHKIYNISVVCMSFGTDADINLDPLSSGAEALWKKGIIVVAAAGNSGPDRNSIKSPGNNPNIITVGALDISSLSVAEFSSRGPTILGHKPDLVAPAVNIFSCNNKHDPYVSMSGTSVATPIVAGICAIVKSKFPQMTNVEVKKYLISHCKKICGDIDVEGAGYLSF